VVPKTEAYTVYYLSRESTIERGSESIVRWYGLALPSEWGPYESLGTVLRWESLFPRRKWLVVYNFLSVPKTFKASRIWAIYITALSA